MKANIKNLVGKVSVAAALMASLVALGGKTASASPQINVTTFGGDGSGYAFINLYGSGFSASGNSINLTCNGGWAPASIDVQMSTFIQLYTYETGWSNECTVQVISNGQTSNTTSVYVPAPVPVAPTISNISFGGIASGAAFFNISGSGFGNNAIVEANCSAPGGRGQALIDSLSANFVQIYIISGGATPTQTCTFQVINSSGLASNVSAPVSIPMLTNAQLAGY